MQDLCGCLIQMRTSVNSLIWTPEGRRCITGTQSGEFTLWNGTQFNFETIIQVTVVSHCAADQFSPCSFFNTMLDIASDTWISSILQKQQLSLRPCYELRL